jgi:hypothetical protein
MLEVGGFLHGDLVLLQDVFEMSVDMPYLHVLGLMQVFHHVNNNLHRLSAGEVLMFELSFDHTHDSEPDVVPEFSRVVFVGYSLSDPVDAVSPSASLTMSASFGSTILVVFRIVADGAPVTMLDNEGVHTSCCSDSSTRSRGMRATNNDGNCSSMSVFPAS